eukprot:728663-Ditylum_brightwellii.AAC.1
MSGQGITRKLEFLFNHSTEANSFADAHILLLCVRPDIVIFEQTTLFVGDLVQVCCEGVME